MNSSIRALAVSALVTMTDVDAGDKMAVRDVS
jgi:hypothetical protein